MRSPYPVACVSMESLEITDRLVIRDWSVDDAAAALRIYGATEVIRWLTPAMDRITDLAAMRSVLQAWSEAQPNLTPPRGRWAVQSREGDGVIGGLAIRLLPPYDEDLELSWAFRPDAWGHGYATEASQALTKWAFTQDMTAPKRARWFGSFLDWSRDEHGGWITARYRASRLTWHPNVDGTALTETATWHDARAVGRTVRGRDHAEQ